ncbi:hypothetical protein TRVA0_003S01442 [Trichomonascus vanleenenianus]|uniref:N-acetylmuramic acid 6-phosphate etherase n=1 Tax=Trichomonascus vanleenenianus TaxID=2268995 RepID=UPI003ECA8277
MAGSYCTQSLPEMTVVDLESLQTEGRNPNSTHIDSVSTVEVVRIMNSEDHKAVAAVTPCLETIAAAIDVTFPKVRAGGRVIYMGAGTSGRLGVLDASEIPPTYSAPANQFIGLIAGGDRAIRNPIEGAEDSPEHGKAALEELNIDPSLDTVVGIASSGRTPYVLGGLAYAKQLGCTTVGISCASPSEMEVSGTVDHLITPITGPEVVTGSTRMKAGTATKLVLNMFSTGIMIKIGKTYGNLMVDVKASNLKLQERSRRIIRAVAGTLLYLIEDVASKRITSAPIELSTLPEDEARARLDELIKACDGSVKLAIAVAKSGLTPVEAQTELIVAGGVLDRVLKQHS